MPRIARQDERAGLKRQAVGNTHMAAYQAKAALKVLDGIAEGKTLKEVCKPEGMPTRQTVYRWVALFPEFSKAYYAARELSAQSLEEDALDMAKTLKEPNDFTGTKVRAFEVAMSQLRWSAARRDPRRYGQRAEDRIIVPIQINTTLDLGGEHAGGLTTPDGDNVYSMRSKVEAIVDTSDSRQETLQAIEDQTAETGDSDSGEAYNLPEEVEPQKTFTSQRAEHLKKVNRARAKHKSPAQVKRAITVMKQKGQFDAGKISPVATKEIK